MIMKILSRAATEYCKQGIKCPPPLPPGKFKTIFNVLNMRVSIYYCVLVIIQDKVTIVIGEEREKYTGQK